MTLIVAGLALCLPKLACSDKPEKAKAAKPQPIRSSEAVGA